jgi:hypothetical protein
MRNDQDIEDCVKITDKVNHSSIAIINERKNYKKLENCNCIKDKHFEKENTRIE